MTSEIIRLLNQMNEEKGAIRECEEMVEKCVRAHHGRQLYISSNWEKHDPYFGSSRERISITLDGEVMNLVLDAISDYYVQKSSEHDEKLEELLLCLKQIESAPDGAATPSKGNETR